MEASFFLLEVIVPRGSTLIQSGDEVVLAHAKDNQQYVLCLREGLNARMDTMSFIIDVQGR